MFKKSAASVLVLAVLAAAGCASVPERDYAMENARASVDAARSNPLVVTYAPSELDQAIGTMRQADELAARGGRTGEVDQLAMLASQRAGMAQDAARARSEEAALMDRRRAADAQVTANISRRQADSAQYQANEAQRQADESQRVASSMQSPIGDYRRRQNEQLFEAPVSYVRAVVGPAQQRCWVSREQVGNASPAGINIPGAIIGGAIGGVIGHQIGAGRGKDLATGIGVIGGAAVGANVGRNPDSLVYTQDVQRCDYSSSSSNLDYWDVTYIFAGSEHRVQMTTRPGATILVNSQGEPRV